MSLLGTVSGIVSLYVYVMEEVVTFCSSALLLFVVAGWSFLGLVSSHSYLAGVEVELGLDWWRSQEYGWFNSNFTNRADYFSSVLNDKSTLSLHNTLVST